MESGGNREPVTNTGASYTWSGVIDFMINERRQDSIREAEWILERKELKEEISKLTSTLTAQESLNVDLMKRVKMLEVCIKKEKLKFMAYLSQANKEERDQILEEIKKNESIPNKIENEISKLRPDLELPKRRAKRQRQFLERILKEFDCTEILEEVIKADDPENCKNSNIEIENELLDSPIERNFVGGFRGVGFLDEPANSNGNFVNDEPAIKVL